MIEMKTIRFISLFFLLLPYTTFSQSGKVIVKFCPLGLTDEVSFPTIQGGLEFGLTKRIAWYNEAGIKYRNSYYENTDTSIVKSSGFKLKTEFRYYFKKISDDQDSYISKSAERYLGANIFYIKDRHNIGVAYYENKDTALYRFDYIGVNKRVYGLNLLAGMQLHFPRIKRLLFDVYAGFGIRLKYINNIDQELDTNKDEVKGTVDVTVIGMKNSFEVEQGLTPYFNLTGGFRLCYRF